MLLCGFVDRIAGETVARSGRAQRFQRRRLKIAAGACSGCTGPGMELALESPFWMTPKR